MRAMQDKCDPWRAGVSASGAGQQNQPLAEAKVVGVGRGERRRAPQNGETDDTTALGRSVGAAVADDGS